MHRARYTARVEDGAIVIEDQDRDRSVTNDAELVVADLAERGFDVRDQVVVRVDGPPVVDAGRWEGFRRHRQRVAASAPLPGLRVLGAAPTPFPAVPFAAWEASGLAVALGKA